MVYKTPKTLKPNKGYVSGKSAKPQKVRHFLTHLLPSSQGGTRVVQKQKSYRGPQ